MPVRIFDEVERASECPECGSVVFSGKDSISQGYRLCVDCGQEWWTDIEYKKSSNFEEKISHYQSKEK